MTEVHILCFIFCSFSSPVDPVLLVYNLSVQGPEFLYFSLNVFPAKPRPFCKRLHVACCLKSFPSVLLYSKKEVSHFCYEFSSNCTSQNESRSYISEDSSNNYSCLVVVTIEVCWANACQAIIF